ncbi:MAG: UPF0758 protein [Patescibacteria group bacterium]|nr:MAG: UPF0758 protein [Patescibacteria group bacterium]
MSRSQLLSKTAKAALMTVMGLAYRQTVQNLPKEERPRERMVRYGASALSAQELLALIMGSGIPGESVLLTAQKLLSKFGSLEGVVSASLAELQTVRGLGIAKATQLKACLEIGKRISIAELNRLMNKPQVLTAEDVAKIVRGVIEDFSKEHLVVLCFDVRQRLVGQEVVSVGILDANLVHPREIFACALKYRAASIILAHNHPSGDAAPSEEDRIVTRRLHEAAKVMGIALLDHVVVTKTSMCSVDD